MGHADRAAYDLDVHAKATGVDLTAQETFDQPRSVEVPKFDVKNAIIGKALGKKSKEVTEYIRAMPLAQALALEKELDEKKEATVRVLIKGDAAKGESAKEEAFVIKREMLSITAKTEMVHTAKYTPNVIEPAFGIGRIFYSILEHTYYVRPAKAAPTPAEKKAESKEDAEDAAARRAVFALPPHLAPTKLSILPISNREEFEPIQKELARAAVQNNITYKIDASAGSIGKRYSKADEIGIPFGITSQTDTRAHATMRSARGPAGGRAAHSSGVPLCVSSLLVDLNTKTDNRVTIRERDSMQQVRVATKDAIPIIVQLSQGLQTWADVYAKEEQFFG